MQIFEIKLAGRIDKETGMPIATATVHRTPGNEFITVTIHNPDGKDRQHVVEASSQEDIWSMAECLQCHMDGEKGTNSTIHDYFRLLSDI
ncbi:MAG: hypothetical protein LLF76_03090 [Planctomycetaceae bacterium]|nr:hypothetical protein [Planctomycetaceae bacterium]